MWGILRDNCKENKVLEVGRCYQKITQVAPIAVLLLCGSTMTSCFITLALKL